MISQVLSFALLASATGLLVAHRPVAEWSGRSAALFCAGLLLTLAAASGLVSLNAQADVLLQQLATYAALPVLAAVLLADTAGVTCQRPAWGRVLLGICALYELMRRAGMLDYLLLGTTVAGGSALLLMLARRQHTPAAIVATLGWVMATASVVTGADTTITAILCSASLIMQVRRAE